MNADARNAPAFSSIAIRNSRSSSGRSDSATTWRTIVPPMMKALARNAATAAGLAKRASQPDLFLGRHLCGRA